MRELLIGSHVRMTAPLYFEGAVRQALDDRANALMLYTGAPQNTVRIPIGRLPHGSFKIKRRRHADMTADQ